MSFKIGFIPTHRDLMDEEYAVITKNVYINKLKKLRDVEVIVPGDDLLKGGLVRAYDDAKKVRKYFDEKMIDAIVIGAITYGDEKTVLSIVENYCNMPVFLFAVNDPEIPNNEFFKSAASCGAIPISYGLHKRNIKFTFGGITDEKDETFDEKLDTFIKVARAVQKYRNARIGMIGARPNDFEVCAVNEGLMLEKYRQKIIHVNLLDIKEEIAGIKDESSEIEEIIAEILSGTQSSYNKKELVNIAKLEILLKKYVRELDLDAIAIQCWTSIQQFIGMTPCLTNGRLTQIGIPVSCEGDVHGAISMLIQQELTACEEVPTLLDILMQHPEEKDLFLAYHCGNSSIVNKDACSAAKVMPHSAFGDVFGKQSGAATLEFMLKSGTITVNRLVEHHGEFKMLNVVGEMVKRDSKIRGGWSWVQVPDREKLYDTVFNQGFTHHVSMIHNNLTSRVKEFCKFLDITFVEV